APYCTEPLVCVQVPIYNERYVAARVIDAVCSLEWPVARLEVQVLDDSDDDTAAIVDARVARWQRRGLSIAHVRRPKRVGFKAGALAHGMTLTEAPFIAIFDADFVPPADFLRRTMGVFADQSIGFVQARWGHLDEGYSWFTRLQALAIDFHFLVEQAVRSARGYFTNFTGTAGVWRRRAIVDSGGWSAATLTEDLDLSYRAQLLGWKAAYLEDLVVPEELPVSIDAYRRQQSRWATGSFQGAFRLLAPVLRSRNRAAVKLQATVHLLSYAVGPLMLLQLACYPWLVLGPGRLVHLWPVPAIAVTINLIGVSPWVGFIVAQTRRGRPWWSGLPALLWQVVGAGMSLTVLLALVRALRGGGEFVRTPKYQIVRRGQEWRDQAYVRTGDPRALGDAVAGLAALALVPTAIIGRNGLIALYAFIFATGFLTVATLTGVEFLEVLTLRSLGLRALARLRSAAPATGLLLAAALLLLAAAQMPQPFEDGFGHWLLAANLAATGHLHDPLFGMEDTWLPGYSVVAAAVLRVFGLWQIGALRVLGVLFGLVTLAAVYRLAPNARQARFAVALLALNPVFLFTASATVVEPMLTALLTSAALAAVRGRMRLASLLAAAACATATKAWIFVAVAAVAALLPGRALGARFRVRVPAPRAVFAIPVIGVLALAPFASNSLARGSQEVASAIARGSLAGDPLARTSELITTFGLAALPLFALGAAGLLVAVRRPDATLRFLHLPALAYLVAVVALVATGEYSGSHRYLYPALPSLALLAALALDRQPAITRIATAAAGGLLAVAFLPVFAGFAAGNTGLIAAGRAASGGQGMLVTDSPVAAFYSGKAPDLIAGSETMPLDRDLAVLWLRSRGVTELIVENISYYRATAVFPDLAAGKATPPFEPLGDESFYQAPGGKQAFAYRLAAGLNQQSLFPGVSAAVEPVPRQGKTAILAKGVTLMVGGAGAAGEGMGLGVPIVRYPDGWVFPRTSTTIDLSTSTQAMWRRIFQLDEIGGNALPGGGFDFAPIPSRGTIAVTYTVDDSGVTISVQPISLAPGYTQVGVLNEESGAFNDFADASQTLVGSAFGSYVPVSGDWARLRSASLGIEWSVPAIAGAQLFGGRETTAPSFDWAGLDYIFTGPFAGTSYHIHVQEAR
ncbi:MAG TPA: glycosyltransferase, partial [Candidatus Dormibacteraeota bacterium]|nr:glycosyltransferase [Candidatus Dormibacteraeota bacterium]